MQGLRNLQIGDYGETAERLNYYMDEYAWLMNSKNPLQDVETALKKCDDELAKEHTQEDEIRISSIRGVLEAKQSYLNEGSYKSNVMRNIVAYTLEMENFEAQNDTNKQEALIKTAAKALGGNEESKKLLKSRLMSFLAGVYGVPGPRNLDYSSRSQVLAEVISSGNFVGEEYTVPEPETSEQSLVVSKENSFLKDKLYEYIQDETGKVLQQFMEQQQAISTAPKDEKSSEVVRLVEQPKGPTISMNPHEENSSKGSTIPMNPHEGKEEIGQ